MSTSTPSAAFLELVGSYADRVAANFRALVEAQPEDQLKAPVGSLLRGAGQQAALDVNWRTEVRADDIDGRPDMGVTVDNLLTGHVELKRPGLGARPERFSGPNRKQWQRFKRLPNLIYTDGSEWSLYRSGELKQRTKIVDDIRIDGATSLAPEDTASLYALLMDFLRWQPVVPSTADGLARYLAPLSRILRDEVQNALLRPDSSLKTLADEWSGLLFPEGGEEQFADAYAQTLTYALLLARFEGAESLRPLMAADALQREHLLLAEALQLLEANPVREELKMPIDLLERAIGAVDSARIGQEGDPWLYFYEQFLGAYDPNLRKKRGVYYTPVEVVRAQTRLAGELLRTQFGKPLAFADDDVVVLDPAVGTGTYPLAVLDHAEESVRGRLGPGAVAGKLRALADRLHAFEILVGPYSVAHLRLSQRFKDAGVMDKAPKVYLTDTLESPNSAPDFTASLLQTRITEERNMALQVKKDMRVFVCLGNPPYHRESRDPSQDGGRRKGGWVRFGDYGDDDNGGPPPILEDFLAPVRDSGGGLHLQTLYNDYVYFWRWALWKVFDSTQDAGIVTFITASSYLRGPGFAGMRRKMRETFDELWIIDLEGDQRGTRKTDNVFAIQTPVAIAIGVRYGPPSPNAPATVRKVRLTGTDRAKLDALDAAHGFRDFDWTRCSDEWDAPFYPEGSGEYFRWPQITGVFPWQHSGLSLHRTWPIGVTRGVLVDRWRDLLGRLPADRRVAFRETRDRKVDLRYLPLFDGNVRDPAILELERGTPPPPILPYSYRSFDRQWIIADSRVGDRMGAPDLWKIHGPRQIYITSLLVDVIGRGPAVTVAADIPDLHHFRGSFGGKAIPLYRNAECTETNVTDGLLETISDALGAPVSPEALFAYAYGILAQPAYVERFWDELEMPPPRLPITKDAHLFRQVSLHGARLLYLHTYAKRFVDADDPERNHGFVPYGSARCTEAVSTDRYPEGFSYDPDTQILKVGDGMFSPVSPEVWDYSISGLQVVRSWLDRRKSNPSGRKSSPLDEIHPERWEFTEQLLELLWILERTITLQPDGEELLAKIFASPLFSTQELPSPTAEERSPPEIASPRGEQIGLEFEAA